MSTPQMLARGLDTPPPSLYPELLAKCSFGLFIIYYLLRHYLQYILCYDIKFWLQTICTVCLYIQVGSGLKYLCSTLQHQYNILTSCIQIENMRYVVLKI